MYNKNIVKYMELQQQKKEKSRRLSIYDFFEILQIEWIVADLRLRLYSKPKDKKYWEKVRDGKRKTIDEIADKNSLPTIFTDSSMKSAFEQRIYRPNCYPNFFYKDENNEREQGFYDLLYYYYKGSDVRCHIMGDIKVGQIKQYHPYDKNIIVRFKDGSEEKMPVENVIRIL